MNILFLTMSRMTDINAIGIYPDLMRELIKKDHKLYIVAPSERMFNEKTHIVNSDNCKLLRVRVGNLQKTNIIEKGISTLLIECQFKTAIKQYFSDVKFDLILYSTPPITFANVIKFVKQRDNAKTYLLLKDIFPQNAVDLKMFSKSSIIYKYFRAKEERLYKLSDYIGCMSQANVDYLLKHNPEINPDKVHINPNSIEVQEVVKDQEAIAGIKKKYNIPEKATTFIYGGNLGKPQGIPFIIECLKANADKTDRFFVICGKGTEYSKLKSYVDAEKPSNVLLLNGLPKAEYDVFVKAFDVGLIFLDHRFTIPNFPSRLLSYMQSSMPVLACTDPNTDVGKVITDGGFGWWCESNSVDAFTAAVDSAINANLSEMGGKGLDYLKENYTAKKGAQIINSYINK